jgi:hypothetical protein
MANTKPDNQSDLSLAEDEVAGMPTKALFVDMLTKDIVLDRAVLDLIDNSIDGARRLRPQDKSELTGLEITVEMDENHFRIKDNCGGIGIDVAKHYAFRFGRPKGMTPTPGAVGQFGVGMKRALFKFGRYFEIQSSTTSDYFLLKVDVDQWEADEQSWSFKFAETKKDLNVPVDQTGTEIVVQKLRENASSSFALEYFRNYLSREIQQAQQSYIDRGLRIVFDGRTLPAAPWLLLQGYGIEPAKQDETIYMPDKDPVFVRILAGISDSSPRQAGWYVFCNGRLVLTADQSNTTGWSTLAEKETVIPKYHNQYARFRGFVFFDSTDASLLPWNTTKTGVDQDSPVYKRVLLIMMGLMRPIIDFLNELDAERENAEDDRPFTSAVGLAQPTRIGMITRVGQFVKPTPSVPSGPPLIRISYKKPRPEFEALQEALDTTSAKQTGEVSFDLTYKQYVGE